MTDYKLKLLLPGVLMFAILFGCTNKPDEVNWAIQKKGNEINISAGIFEQKLVLSDDGFFTSALSVAGENVLKANSDEISFSIHKASPNIKPEGIRYSSESGVEQSNAEQNQTDALSVKKVKEGIAANVQWGDSMYIAGETFVDVFAFEDYEISSPQQGVKRLVLKFTSNKISEDFSFEINYEIYEGHPVIRKWVRFDNQGNQWIKISDLMLKQLDLGASFSQVTLLTPAVREIDPAIIAFSDAGKSLGVISVSEIPSKTRHLSADGNSGYNPGYFEWVLGPGETFESEPVFEYAFSGESYETVSAKSTALDRCVESSFASFMDKHIVMPLAENKSVAPVFCTWTNYNSNINDKNMREAADIASEIGFECFQLDAGWSDTGPRGGWAVSTTNPKAKEFPDMKGLSRYIQSKNMKTGMWYSVFINEQETDISASEPGLFSLPLIRRAGGLALSFCYEKSRKKYVDEIVYLNKTFGATYFKQDLSNICYGDIARGHESRTKKESYLRGLRGLFATQDEILRQSPETWLQLSHEIYWETPGPAADVAVLKHVDSYHASPNEYWGAGNRKTLVDDTWNFDVDSLKQQLRLGAFRAREIMYNHRGLPLERIEIFGAATTNYKGSLSADILDRQICSWLMGVPLSYSGDLTSLTTENIAQYRNRFAMLKRLNRQYGIYSHFQYSGVPAPTDEEWHWWGKLNDEGCGAVIVLRGSSGADSRQINIPWVKADKTYQLKALFSGKDLGEFTGKQLVDGELNLSLPHLGQEIIEISLKKNTEK
ncbi:alpha-galactosidase [Maribellus sp. CM-23]|uniref:alpha-galactosidase n=1 Tax=Maribellus sp. CM-23 TaxID=2781026 RepID=UPI001F1BA8F0|nr:alpha-galactosidase [Maribellus sp. CM-23]MCE4565898.1 alpha-galactosidase [Maribellus sp. CM-23]